MIMVDEAIGATGPGEQNCPVGKADGDAIGVMGAVGLGVGVAVPGPSAAGALPVLDARTLARRPAGP